MLELTGRALLTDALYRSGIAQARYRQREKSLEATVLSDRVPPSSLFGSSGPCPRRLGQHLVISAQHATEKDRIWMHEAQYQRNICLTPISQYFLAWNGVQYKANIDRCKYGLFGPVRRRRRRPFKAFRVAPDIFQDEICTLGCLNYTEIPFRSSLLGSPHLAHQPSYV